MLRIGYLICFGLLCPLWVFAQQPAMPHARPKIGVVLSGGGAKGLAHIGALKILEQAGVKIDYIGGTSMGAIVGGLYASGYSANQLDSIFSNIDVEALLQDMSPRNSKSFFSKKNNEKYALTLPFSHFKIGVPSGLSKGLYNYNLLSKLTHHVANITQFDQLSIPFVCVATNVETGEKVVFKEGILTDAILASGAFPSLYNPVEINGQLLIDGGVTDNYPVEEVRKMGADIIIGVDVQDGLKDREHLKGVMGVLIQISNFSMVEQMEQKRQQTNIYIKPNIKGYSVVSFDKGKAIICAGEEAAMLHFDQLKDLGNQPIERSVKCSDSLKIREIAINDLNRYTRSYVIGKLKFKPNSTISFNKFDEGLYNLNVSQDFSSIKYHFHKNSDGSHNLLFELKENPVQTYLKFGLHYNELYKSAGLINITTKNALSKNDNISLDLVFGDNFRYDFTYHFDNGFHWGYGFHSRYNSFNRNILSNLISDSTNQSYDVATLNLDYSESTQQVYLQTIVAQKFVSGVGAELKYLKIGSSTLGKRLENSDYFSLYAYAQYDSYDNKYYPKRGWYYNGSGHLYLSSSNYNNTFEEFSELKSEFGIAYSIGKRVAFELQTEGGMIISDKRVPYFNFALGGYGYVPLNNFRHFYGYDFISLLGNNYVKARATINYEFAHKNYFNLSANFANIGYDIFKDSSYLRKPKYSGYAIGYGMETAIGPFELKHSYSPETQKHFTWLSIGFWF